MSWRSSVVWWEILANLRANRFRQGLVIGFFAAALSALALAETAAASQAMAQTVALRAAGSNVYIARLAQINDDPQLDASACASLEGLPQVVAAGGLVDLGYVELADSPGTPLRRFGANGRLANVLDADAPPAAIGGGWISRRAAAQVGVSNSERVTDGTQTFPVAWFHPERRHPSGESLIMAPMHTDTLHECWFEVAPGASKSAVAMAITVFSDEPSLNVIPLLGRGEFIVDPLDTFSKRGSRWLWLATGAAMAVTILVMQWFTRSDSALYRSLGASRLDIVHMHTAEVGVIVAYSALIAFVFAGFADGTASGFDPTAIWVGVRSGLAAALTCLCLTIAGSLLVSRGSIARQLKDRG